MWETVFKELAGDADPEYAMIDRTIVQARPHSAGALKKRCAGDRAKQGGPEHQNPRHMRRLGHNPTSFHLTEGQAHDLDSADVLLPLVQADTILGDRGYDADARVLEPLEAAGKRAVIPRRRTAKSNDGMTKRSTRHGTPSRTSLPNSSSFGPSPRVTTKPPETFAPLSISSQASSGLTNDTP